MKKPLPKLKTAMTPFPYSIEVDADIAQAAAILAEHDFHHLPVTAHGQLVGQVTAGALAALPPGEPRRRVREVYSDDPYIVDLHQPLITVLNEMARRRADAAIVVRHGKLVGVFTAGDACAAFAALLDTLDPPPPEGNDAA
jgi:acetoin utilization protein AcuB